VVECLSGEYYVVLGRNYIFGIVGISTKQYGTLDSDKIVLRLCFYLLV
jgi:hypothetical protein